MEETLKQILFELKEIKTSQAVLEQTAQKSHSDILNLTISNIGLNENQAVLEQELTRVSERLDTMQATLAKVAVIQENDVLPGIKVISEGHDSLIERLGQLENLPEQVEDIQSAVSALTHGLKVHTHD